MTAFAYYRCRCGNTYREALGEHGCPKCDARRPARLVTPKLMVRKTPLRPGTKRMRQGRSTGKPTQAQQARHDAIKEIGCIVAVIRGLKRVDCELHHLTVGGKHGAKRRGQDHVVGLNPWSHRGETFNGLSVAQCLDLFGPSYAKEPSAFRALYPDERLEAATNEAIAMSFGTKECA